MPFGLFHSVGALDKTSQAFAGHGTMRDGGLMVSAEERAIEHGTDGSVLQALLRVAHPDAQLARQLAAIGIDVENLELTYRSEQWAQAIEAVRAALFPELPKAEGERKLGYEFARGYGQTLSGSLLLATLPLLGPRLLLKNWPRFVRMGRTDVSITVTLESTNRAHVHSMDPALVPAFFNLGLFDYVFERMNLKLVARIERDEAGEALVELSW